MNPNLQARALERAAKIRGGTEALAFHIGVPHPTLLLWMQGKATLPARVMDAVLDILLAEDVAAAGGRGIAEPQRTIRVLVVDDDATGAYGLARVVKELGHPVEIATDGPSAVEIARRLRPDVVFMDLRLPGMDGVEIAQALRAEGLAPHIIAATSYQSELERDRTLSAGFDAHVIKPIDPGALKILLNVTH